MHVICVLNKIWHSLVNIAVANRSLSHIRFRIFWIIGCVAADGHLVADGVPAVSVYDVGAYSRTFRFLNSYLHKKYFNCLFISFCYWIYGIRWYRMSFMIFWEMLSNLVKGKGENWNKTKHNFGYSVYLHFPWMLSNASDWKGWRSIRFSAGLELIKSSKSFYFSIHWAEYKDWFLPYSPSKWVRVLGNDIFHSSSSPSALLQGCRNWNRT